MCKIVITTRQSKVCIAASEYILSNVAQMFSGMRHFDLVAKMHPIISSRSNTLKKYSLEHSLNQ